MYTQFYGFREKPFNLVPDPSFLYLSTKHRTALSYLEYGLMEGIGFILLTGEIGAGKTTLVKHLLPQIGSRTQVAVIFNTNVSSKQLLEIILDEYELNPPAQGKASYFDVLNQFLVSQHGLGHKVLLIVDEAQNLSREALEEIRMLSNLQTDKDPLLQILLVGQPHLRNRLQQPSLAQLSQRIAVTYHLAPLSLEETTEYIMHRLKVAGAKDETFFTPEAVEQIFEYSGGIPRTINILCDAGLVYGYADELKSIDAKVIEHVVQDKKEMGILGPPDASEQVQPEDGEFQGNGHLTRRLESLEQRISHLSVMVDQQVEVHKSRADSYKDTLVQRLETMLAKERQRADRILVKYNVLRDRLNLSKGKPKENN